MPLVFMLDADKFNEAFVAVNDAVASGAGGGESETSDVEVGSATADDVDTGSSKKGGRKNGSGGGGDLRKKLLKSEQAKSSRRTRAQEVLSTPTPSRLASLALSDPMQVDGDDGRASTGTGPRGCYQIPSNGSRYVGAVYVENPRQRKDRWDRRVATSRYTSPSA